ncbi:S-layer homology domain-containing protein [Sporosarcina sp. E16_8]|uniref:S-layer homology domain-containing protein n=1 Tax=Sporosarcina sp. E16_8 TaxID=2789295 RepID=UPI001A9381B3|nr:S-layer homology domain-containing protein [Sporosarcina sp. E16_8]MBO0589652.1 S-layer homology domain-containing protein [Sporosarcina sp. E16_8]
MNKIHILFFALALTVALPTLATVVLAANVAEAQAVKSEDVTTATKFTDIPNSHWAKNEVMQLVEMGIMTGYGDMQFRPDVTITVSEAAQSFTKAGYESLIRDVASNSFGMDEPLTRKQMESELVRVFNLQVNGHRSALIDWPSLPSVYKGSVGIVSQYGTIAGTQNGLSNRETQVDRATFAVMLHQALVEKGNITTIQKYKLSNLELSENFEEIPSIVSLMVTT